MQVVGDGQNLFDGSAEAVQFPYGTAGYCNPRDLYLDWNIEHVTTFTWQSIGYPGAQWWIQAKSPVIHTPDHHSYYFNTHDDVPATPFSCGASG